MIRRAVVRLHPGPYDTGFEALAHLVHIEERIPDAGSGRGATDQALIYAWRLAGRLGEAYPSMTFEVVVAVSDAPVVRFYRRRPAQPWLDADLESSGSEAVLALTVAPE